MKTSQGKLAALAFLLLLAAVLFLPMRAGEEDALILSPSELYMSVGDSYTVHCALSSENMNQRLHFYTSDQWVARIGLDGTVYAVGSGEATIRAEASGGASAELLVKVAGVPMTQLRLNVEELTIDKGEYSGLRAEFNSDATDTRVRWLSSDERVVRVDDSGRVEGVGGGDAYVSAVSTNGMSATATVHVRVAGTAVHISPNQLTLGVGARVPLAVSYLPLDCTDEVRNWISSNANVLAVTEDGALQARNPGSAYVTVVTEGGLTSGMEVQVEPAPRELQLDPTRATLERGDTLQMQLMFLERDGEVETGAPHLVTWRSSDPSVASVDDDGLVTALKSGTCQIEAASDGMIVSCRLNVQVTIREITLDREEVYLLREEANQPIQLHARCTPSDADNPNIVFTSDNEQVATVQQNGRVDLTGGYGTAVITVSAASGAQARFTVNVVTQLPSEVEEEISDDEAGEETSGEVSGDGEEAPAEEDDTSGEAFPSDDADSIWGDDDAGSIWSSDDGDDSGVAGVYEGDDMYGGEPGGEVAAGLTPNPNIIETPVPNVTQEPFDGILGVPTLDPEADSPWN